MDADDLQTCIRTFETCQEVIRSQQAEIERLDARIAELEADARRYAYWRASFVNGEFDALAAKFLNLDDKGDPTEADVDAAIDAAMEQEKKG